MEPVISAPVEVVATLTPPAGGGVEHEQDFWACESRKRTSSCTSGSSIWRRRRVGKMTGCGFGFGDRARHGILRTSRLTFWTNAGFHLARGVSNWVRAAGDRRQRATSSGGGLFEEFASLALGSFSGACRPTISTRRGCREIESGVDEPSNSTSSSLDDL